MGVLQTKIFCANTCPTTNEWASKIFSKSWQSKSTFGVNHDAKGGRSSNSGAAESREYNVEPDQFITLAKGGPQNRYIVQSIIFGGGRVFRSTGTTALRTQFHQKG